MSSIELQTGNGGPDIDVAALAEHMSNVGNWTLNPDDGKDLKDFLERFLEPLAGVFAEGAGALSGMAETLADHSPVDDSVCELLGQMSTVLHMLQETAEQLPAAMRVGNREDLERIENQRPNEPLANVSGA